MPHSVSARKRLRQNQKRNLRNRMVKGEIKTFMKKILAAIDAKKGEEARALLRETHAKLDKAATKGVLHKNTVARRKSNLARKVAALGAV
ncbi:MAG: 30S ribosomal protein S20 [Planctomycetes bacterium]|nr:30S ribosomal protein S20 [Planctomycetota bacterium]